MQKGVLKVAMEFCATRTKAAAGGEGKYVTLNISSSVCFLSPGCPLTTTGACMIIDLQERDSQASKSGQQPQGGKYLLIC